MSEKNVIRFSMLLLGLLVLILVAGCQPQIVEVEVTQVVTETETIIEEVVIEIEVTKEVEVVKEVEVIIEVEGEAEISEEAAEEAPLAMEDSGEGDSVEATGSEEDDDNPGTPTNRKVGSDQEVEQKISWIQASGVITDTASVRVLAPRIDDVLFVMTVTDGGEERELILTPKIKRYRQSNEAQINNRLYLTIAPDEWEFLETWLLTLSAEGATADYTCDFCAAGEAGERYSIISEDQVISFELDAGESVAEIEPFLTTLRAMLDESGAYSQSIWNSRN